jgi:hypothetical protein
MTSNDVAKVTTKNSRKLEALEVFLKWFADKRERDGQILRDEEEESLVIDVVRYLLGGVEVPDEALQALIAECRKNEATIRAYVQTKAN